MRRIAERVHAYAAVLAKGLEKLGHKVATGPYFDTIRVTPKAPGVLEAARARRINLRDFGDGWNNCDQPGGRLYWCFFDRAKGSHVLSLSSLLLFPR